MTVPAPCPERARWEELLEGGLPKCVQAELGRHVEHCARCQRVLDELSSAAALDPDLARRLGQGRAAAESALRQALEALKGEIGTDETQADSSESGALSLDFLDPSDEPGQLGRLGHYEVLEVIGKGGMGVVLKACDEKLHRVVAIKVMAPQLATSATARKRFAREAQVAAAICHDHVVDIHAVEELNGLPCIIMQYIAGGSLRARLQQSGPLPPREVARIGIEAAAGLAAAHAVGLIHRDIKPANILEETDTGRIRITDFGLARAVADGSLSQTGVIAGTPQYMAPEQARGQPLDHRADIYSLGVTLYELATGQPAIAGESALEVLRQVETEEPLPPRRRNQAIPVEVEIIILKAIAKSPLERYATVEELADDLRCFLEDRPIRARRPTAVQRLRKFARRHRPVVATMAVSAVLLLAATVTVALATLAAGNVRIRQEQKETEKALGESEKALRQAATLALGQGLLLCEQGQVGQGLLWQARALRMMPANSPELERTIRLSLPAWAAALPLLRAVISLQGADTQAEWCLSPDGRVLLAREDDGVLRLWETATGRPVGQPLRHAHPVADMVFADDGKVLLTVSDVRGNSKVAGPEMRLHLWDAATGQPLREPIPHPDRIELTVTNGRRVVAISPDGKTVATGTKGAVHLWDVATGRARGQPLPVQGVVRFVAFSADGTFLVAAGLNLPPSADGEFRSWDAATGQPLGEPIPTSASRREVVSWWGLGAFFSPDRKVVLAYRKGGDAQLHDVTTGKAFGQPIPEQQANYKVHFSPDSKVLATVGRAENDRTMLRLWDAATGQSRGALLHEAMVSGWAFSPDGQRILTYAADDTVRLWSTATGTPSGSPLAHRARVVAVACSPDGKVVLTGCRDGTARLWAAEGRVLGAPLQDEGFLPDVAFSADGRSFLTVFGYGFASGLPRSLRLWGLKPEPEHRSFPNQARIMAFSPDGQTVLTGRFLSPDESGKGEAQVWHLATGKPLGGSVPYDRFFVRASFSPDGKMVASRTTFGRGTPGEVRVWDAATGELLSLIPHKSGVPTHPPPAFTPDGKTLLVTDRGAVNLWDTATGRLRLTIPAPGGPVVERIPGESTIEDIVCLAVSPDGQTVATGRRDKTARLWEVATGKPRAVLRHPAAVWAVAFSPDGRTLLSGCKDNRARLWDLATGKLAGPPLEHGRGPSILASISAVAFSPDGKLMATVGGQTVRVWEVATGRPIGPPLHHQAGEIVLAFTPDGQALLTGCQDVVRRWPLPAPLDGDAQRIELWVQVLTGMELDEYGTVRWLDGDVLAQRRWQLEACGGPPNRAAKEEAP
jgi:WD40 repeat protein/tRNA A-37 threonylcarbamoyl transferase component Bud32